MFLSKKNSCVSIILLITTFVFLINTKDTVTRNLNLNPSVLKQERTIPTRHVEQFKATKHYSAKKDFFQQFKKENSSRNEKITTSNTSSFDYQLKYSNYNIYGARNNDFITNNTKNADKQISVGLNLITSMTVKIAAAGQKWANLSITKKPIAENTISQSSIYYSVIGSKTVSNAEISFYECFKYRKKPNKIVKIKIGTFNVDNTNHKFSQFVKSTLGMTLITATLAGIIAITLTAEFIFWKAYQYNNSIQRDLRQKLTSLFNLNSDQRIELGFDFGKYNADRDQLLLAANQNTRSWHNKFESRTLGSQLSHTFERLNIVAENPSDFASGWTHSASAKPFVEETSFNSGSIAKSDFGLFDYNPDLTQVTEITHSDYIDHAAQIINTLPEVEKQKFTGFITQFQETGGSVPEIKIQQKDLNRIDEILDMYSDASSDSDF